MEEAQIGYVMSSPCPGADPCFDADPGPGPGSCPGPYPGSYPVPCPRSYPVAFPWFYPY